jgi:hypothetical protein
LLWQDLLQALGFEHGNNESKASVTQTLLQFSQESLTQYLLKLSAYRCCMDITQRKERKLYFFRRESLIQSQHKNP